MAVPLEIPLIPSPQSFRLQLVGAFYSLSCRWCIPAGCWVLDIADADEVPIVAGLPLITGADLLAQYEYLGIGGQLIVQSDDDVNAVPTFDNLGSIGHLYFISAE